MYGMGGFGSGGFGRGPGFDQAVGNYFSGMMQGGNMTMPARNYGGSPSPGFGGEQIMPQPAPRPMPGYFGGGFPMPNPMPRPMPMPMPGYGGDAGFRGVHPGGSLPLDRGMGYNPQPGGMPQRNPGLSYGGGIPSPDGGPEMNPGFSYGGMPSPDGGPANYRYPFGSDMGSTFTQMGRKFNNGDPFYNARGNLRMRYRDQGEG